MIDTAQKIFEAFPSQPGVSTELFLTQTDSRSLTWADGKLDMENRSTQRGLTVRLLMEARASTSSTQDFSEDSARGAWMSAAEALKFSQPDPAITFPAMAPASGERLGIDADIFSKRGEEMKKSLQNFEKW